MTSQTEHWNSQRFVWSQPYTVSFSVLPTPVRWPPRSQKQGPQRIRRPLRVESESIRSGALQYLAAWDVHRAKVFGRCERATGILSFGRMVDDVRWRETYALADRVFWIVENGLSYRGRASCERLRQAYPNATLVHMPVGSNSTEIYFSIVQRKALVLNDLQSLAGRLLAFQDYIHAVRQTILLEL